MNSKRRPENFGRAIKTILNLRWLEYRRRFLELFVILNFAILAVDIALAHSINRFRNPAEWVPLIFSVLAPLVLIAGHYWHDRRPDSSSQFPGLLVGGLAIVLGIAGLIYHLESQFFVHYTLKSLVYTAPFIAPLAYTGLGFLVLLNIMVDDKTPEWSVWVILLALGGIGGNFVLTLADHAQNGFFHLMEWVPVAVSAYAVGFLAVSVTAFAGQRFLNICLAILALQAAVGVAGFYFHIAPSFNAPSAIWLQTVIHGPPALAPLLFPNLALLAALGVLDLKAKKS